jgi:hypothetical protein
MVVDQGSMAISHSGAAVLSRSAETQRMAFRAIGRLSCRAPGTVPARHKTQHHMIPSPDFSNCSAYAVNYARAFMSKNDR